MGPARNVARAGLPPRSLIAGPQSLYPIREAHMANEVDKNKIKEAVARSFRNPFASLTKESTGIISNKDVMAVKAKEGNFDSASAVELNKSPRT